VPPAISTGTAALLHNLQKHDGAVRSIAFSADGALLASGSSDRAINVWDVGVGRLLQTLVGHADWINRLDFVGDTHVLASGSHDGSVRLWNADSGQHVQTMEPSFMERLMEVSSVILDVATSPDGRVVASTSGRGVVRLWSCDTYRLQSVLKGHTTYLSSLAYSADNRLLACCDSGDGLDRICIWEWQHQKMISAFNVRAGGITALAFSPDAKVIATSGRDGTVRLWNPLNGELLRTLTGNSAMNAVAFSPDGTRIAAGSANGSLRMWDAQERGLLHSFRVHDGAVQAVAFQPGSDLVATAGADSVVRIWRI
jgi:WD40 repeat protein